MTNFKLAEAVSNYRKLQLYATDNLTIHDSIISDLQQMLSDKESYNEMDFLSRLIVYLEFGLSYKKHEKLFRQILQVTSISFRDLGCLVNKQYRFIKVNKSHLRDIIICNGKGCDNCQNKHDIICEILELIKYNKQGMYNFHCKYNTYCLIINNEKYLLRNTTKDIEYYLIT